MPNNLFIEAVELGDIDMLEEEIVPCTGCGCECYAPPPAAGGGGGGGSTGGGGTGTPEPGGGSDPSLFI